MKPINFKEQNAIYKASGCGDLPALKLDGEIISKWKGTLIDRIKYLLTGCMWFSALSNSHPPIWLGTTFPRGDKQ